MYGLAANLATAPLSDFIIMPFLALAALGWFGWQRFGATDDATTADIVAAPGDTSVPGGVAEEPAMPTTTPAPTPAPAACLTARR